MRLDPYLNFPGNAREALELYQSVFGGKLDVMTYREFGGAGQPESQQDNVMHGSVTLPNGDLLMASDLPSATGGTGANNNSYIMVGVESREDAERVYRQLSVGGNARTELTETDFADRYAEFTDRFGINWMIYFGGSKWQS